MKGNVKNRISIRASLLLVLLVVISCTQQSGSESSISKTICGQRPSQSFKFRNETLSVSSGKTRIVGIFRNNTGKVTQGDFPVQVTYLDSSGKVLDSEKLKLVVFESGIARTKVIKVNEETDFSLDTVSPKAPSAASVHVVGDDGFLCDTFFP